MNEPIRIEISCSEGLPDVTKAEWGVGEIIEVLIGPEEDQGNYRVIKRTATTLTLEKVSPSKITVHDVARWFNVPPDVISESASPGDTDG